MGVRRRRSDRFGDRRALVQHVGEQHLGAFRGEQARFAFALSARRPRDERDLAVEPSHETP